MACIRSIEVDEDDSQHHVQSHTSPNPSIISISSDESSERDVSSDQDRTPSPALPLQPSPSTSSDSVPEQPVEQEQQQTPPSTPQRAPRPIRADLPPLSRRLHTIAKRIIRHPRSSFEACRAIVRQMSWMRGRPLSTAFTDRWSWSSNILPPLKWKSDGERFCAIGRVLMRDIASTPGKKHLDSDQRRCVAAFQRWVAQGRLLGFTFSTTAPSSSSNSSSSSSSPSVSSSASSPSSSSSTNASTSAHSASTFDLSFSSRPQRRQRRTLRSAEHLIRTFPPKHQAAVDRIPESLQPPTWTTLEQTEPWTGRGESWGPEDFNITF